MSSRNSRGILEEPGGDKDMVTAYGGWEQGGILFVSVCVVGRGKYIRAFSCQFRKRADFKSRTG